jgi:hypothetical protein
MKSLIGLRFKAACQVSIPCHLEVVEQTDDVNICSLHYPIHSRMLTPY